jgi:hypothetical protein
MKRESVVYHFLISSQTQTEPIALLAAHLKEFVNEIRIVKIVNRSASSVALVVSLTSSPSHRESSSAFVVGEWYNHSRSITRSAQNRQILLPVLLVSAGFDRLQM